MYCLTAYTDSTKINRPGHSISITVVEIRISKPNGCQVLGPIFLESTMPGVFKTDIREFADFHPSETLDQNQFLEVILLNKVKSFKNKSNFFIK